MGTRVHVYKPYNRFGGYERGFHVIMLNVPIYTPLSNVQMEIKRTEVSPCHPSHPSHPSHPITRTRAHVVFIKPQVYVLPSISGGLARAIFTDLRDKWDSSTVFTGLREKNYKDSNALS